MDYKIDFTDPKFGYMWDGAIYTFYLHNTGDVSYRAMSWVQIS